MTWIELQQCVGTSQGDTTPVWISLEHVVKIDFVGMDRSNAGFQAARLWLEDASQIETRDGGDIETLRKYLRRGALSR